VTWSPEQYERFKDERGKPFFDLLARVQPAPGMKVLDLGCGTGELTRELHRRLGAAETLGIDSSEAMLERSAAIAGGGLRFERRDIAESTGGPWDLVFSNAALQWLPDHPTLLSRLTHLLTGGGQLAIQVPANHDHVSHTLAAEVAEEPTFRDALGGFVRQPSVLAPEVYAELLHALGFVEQVVRLHVYGHVLASRDDVVEWVKGTLLTVYRARLPEGLYPHFVERYRQRLLESLDDTRPFFYPFKRILLWARR
jgi:trans-aconitate 2-methyltransferase